jgi:hypothetical protein
MGTTARAVVQETGSLPDAPLGGALQVEQKRAGGMPGFQGLEGVRGGVDDDGQFVIQVVRGSGGNGTGSVGVRQSFHTSTLAGERVNFRGLFAEQLWNQRKIKKCLCDY